MPPDLTDDQLDALADRVIDRLNTGRHGDRWLLSRRQILALGGMGLSATGLMALGVDEATAQSAAGQVGQSGSPVDVFAAALDAQSVSTDTETIETRSNYPLGLGDDARPLYDTSDSNNGNRGLRVFSAADTVGTSSTTLASNILNTFVAFVSGGDQNSNRFVDRVSGSAFDGVTQMELHTRNSPAPRSYSENSGAFELAMGSGSYDVSIWLLRFDLVN